ncbi:MAG: bactofilin family protein [Chitinophagales bacterium]
MFGDKKTTTVNKANENFAANVIQDGTIINGQIESKGNIRIDGKVEGTLKIAAKLVVGKTGNINGDITCQNASVEGKIVGTIKVDGLLNLKSTARIEGDIITKKLVVEEGAVFHGNSSMLQSAQTKVVSNAGQKRAV